VDPKQGHHASACTSVRAFHCRPAHVYSYSSNTGYPGPHLKRVIRWLGGVPPQNALPHTYQL
jgi:hypothetical protein